MRHGNGKRRAGTKASKQASKQEGVPAQSGGARREAEDAATRASRVLLREALKPCKGQLRRAAYEIPQDWERSDATVDETAIRVQKMENAPPLCGPDDAVRYLIRAVKNAALDRRRADARRRSRERRLDDESTPAPAAPVASPEMLLIQREEWERKRRKLRKALDLLTPKQRIVIELILQSLKLKEIAKRLNITPGAVKKIRGRAVARLRKEFDEAPLS